VVEERVLRRKSGLKKRDWRRLQNEEFNNLYSSPSVIMVIK
jgi:hypothetical protein